MILDNTEITDRIYDTLMGNKQWPQIKTDEIGYCWIDNRRGEIHFEYAEKIIILTVKSKNIE